MDISGRLNVDVLQGGAPARTVRETWCSATHVGFSPFPQLHFGILGDTSHCRNLTSLLSPRPSVRGSLQLQDQRVVLRGPNEHAAEQRGCGCRGG